MPRTCNAVRVTESVRELLKLMNFETVPAEATFILFFEDGEACFTDQPMSGGFDLGTTFIVHIHQDIEFIEEERVVVTEDRPESLTEALRQQQEGVR